MIATWAIAKLFSFRQREESLPVWALREVFIVLAGAAIGCFVATIIFFGVAGLASGGLDDFVWDGPSLAFLARFVLTATVFAMFLGVSGTAFVALEQAFLFTAGLSRRWSYAIAVCSGAPLGAAMTQLGQWSAGSAVLGATFGLCCACAWGALDLMIPLVPERNEVRSTRRPPP